MLPSQGYVDPVVAWSLVVVVVGVASALLGYLHEISHTPRAASPHGDEPTRYRDAA